MALTELTIKHLKPKETAYRTADSGGLSIEVSPAGGKLWRWRYYFNQKEQMLALGKWPAVSLAEARRRRDAAREQVEAGSRDTFVSNSPRCKIIPANEIISARHWMVDRWWSDEEKKDLGIKEAISEISEEDFVILVKEAKGIIDTFLLDRANDE